MGEPGLTPQPQIEDSLERGWIVLTPDHRLCPQVDIREGPMGDIRSFHTWLHIGGLDAELAARSIPFAVDKSKIIASGTASGGHAALCLAFDNEPTPPPAAIIEFYAPNNFAHPWWRGQRDHLDINVPELTPEMEQMVFADTQFLRELLFLPNLKNRGGYSSQNLTQQHPPICQLASPILRILYTTISFWMCAGRLLPLGFPSANTFAQLIPSSTCTHSGHPQPSSMA